MGTEVPDPVSMPSLANKNPELFALVDYVRTRIQNSYKECYHIVTC